MAKPQFVYISQSGKKVRVYRTLKKAARKWDRRRGSVYILGALVASADLQNAAFEPDITKKNPPPKQTLRILGRTSHTDGSSIIFDTSEGLYFLDRSPKTSPAGRNKVYVYHSNDGHPFVGKDAEDWIETLLKASADLPYIPVAEELGEGPIDLRPEKKEVKAMKANLKRKEAKRDKKKGKKLPELVLNKEQFLKD